MILVMTTGTISTGGIAARISVVGVAPVVSGAFPLKGLILSVGGLRRYPVQGGNSLVVGFP